jgi:hypothetical protein
MNTPAIGVAILVTSFFFLGVLVSEESDATQDQQAQFRELIADKAAAEERARIYEQQLSEQSQAANAEPAPPEPEVFTESQVQQAMDDGQITMAQGAKLLAKQEIDQATSGLRKSLRDDLVSESNSQNVDQQIDSYGEFVPGLAKQGSSDWQAANDEYKNLVRLGLPTGKATEIAACRNVFGSLDNLRAAQSETRDTHPEVGAGGRGGVSEASSQIPKVFRGTHFERDYSREIELGTYSGWNDPNLLKEAAIAERKVRERRERLH